MAGTRLERVYDELRKLAAKDRSSGNPGASADVAAQKIEDVLTEILTSDEETRFQLMKTWSKSESSALLSFARSMATRAVRKRSFDAVRFGVLALLLENRKEDARETISTLCLLCRSASIIGASFESVVDESLHYGVQETADVFAQYCKSGSRNISSFGFRELGEGSSFRYEQIR